MYFTLIEPLDNERTVEVAGQAFPAISILEDEDGVRMLLVDSDSITSRVWLKASMSGVAAIIRPDAAQWACMSVDSFMDGRTEDLGRGVYVAHGLWRASPEPPGFRDVLRLDHQVAPEVTTPFVHLHAHSEFSALDGLSRIHEMVEAAASDAQPALALTDHGVCAGHPELQALTRKAGIKPIFGLEAYLVNDRFERPDPKPQAKDYPTLNEEGFAEVIARWTIERDRVKDYYHLILWAMTQQGLANVWAASTEAHRDGFYSHPRLDWDTLARYSEGVMASTACLRGPLPREILRENDAAVINNLGRLQGIYGDNLAVEIHTANLPEQRIVNEALLSIAQERSLMTVAAVDSHYPCHHHGPVHKVWLAAQTNTEIQDETGLFSGETDYHLMSAKETREALSYLPAAAVDEAMANTMVVAGKCNAEVKGETAMPVYSKQGGETRDRERAVEVCLAAWKEKTAGKPHDQQVYMDRFEKEARLLSMKGFWGYYLIVWDYVRYARENRILVGPGRGSGGGSLIAYLMGIVGIDPVESDLIFERFLTEGRDSPPDFDIDFPTSKRGVMTAYVTEKYGSDSVVRVGVHTRLKNKGVIENLFRVLKNAGMDLDFADQKKLSEIITRAEAHTAGLGLSWEALWDQHGDQLNPFREKYPELFGYADMLVGRLKSYGRHAAGLVIASDRTLADKFPMRMAGDKDNRQLVSDFPMDAMELLGLLKFDFLTLRTLDTIQVCVDMVEAESGRFIDVDSWRDEYADPQVWEEVAAGKTLGIFQIETVAGTRLTREFGPHDISDLADVITLVRPGPKNSGLTDTYLRRRAGREMVTYPDARLVETLGRTQGCIIYQEQIMNTCSLLAGYTLEEADTVRRILGKKKVDAVVAEGQKFLPACVERGMNEQAAALLWAQMAEFAKYSFNRSHAWGYAVLGFWTAWLKFHYPAQFLAAALSTVDQDRIPEFVGECRRQGYKVLPPDVNESARGFVRGADGLSVRYGLEGVSGVGEKAAPAIIEGQPYTSFEDFVTRKVVNSGVTRSLAAIGAFDSMVPNRKALEARLEWEASKDSTHCAMRDESVSVTENNLPCTFDWAAEPVVLGKSGRPLKGKPPPKKCSRACRQYVAPTPPDESREYTAAEIRNREMDLLGVWLSSTPFDDLPEGVFDDLMTAEEIEDGPPDNDYPSIAYVVNVRPTQDRYGKDMAFVSLNAQNGLLDAVVFKDAWSKYGHLLKAGRLVFVMFRKDRRSLRVDAVAPVPA